MKIIPSAALFLVATAMMAQNPQPAKSADQLWDLAKQARHSGDLQGEANNLCQAAALDPKKYEKKCDKAKEDLSRMLAQFHADLAMGRTEIERKDYPGALRDLGKITFGPDKEAAQQLILQARLASGMLSPEQVSQLALQSAEAAYLRGDLDTAEALLKRVQSPAQAAAANQIQTNIHVYFDTMKQANDLTSKGDLKGAVQKYQFAARIRPNGPGDPIGHLKEALDAQAKAEQQQTQQQSSQQVTPPEQQAETDDKEHSKVEARIQKSLALARRQEAGGDLKGALQSYDSVLKLDRQQSDARVGRKRVLEQMQNDRTDPEGILDEGISEFYASQFNDASEIINKYLQEGGKEYAGAAHFYLGASLLSLSLLSDPKNETNVDALKKEAEEQFVQARQLHYVPLRAAVSPKILSRWSQAGDQQ